MKPGTPPQVFGDPREPGDTLPPVVPDETLVEAMGRAIAWEYRRNLAGWVQGTPEDHGARFAKIAYRAMERWASPAGGPSPQG